MSFARLTALRQRIIVCLNIAVMEASFRVFIFQRVGGVAGTFDI